MDEPPCTGYRTVPLPIRCLALAIILLLLCSVRVGADLGTSPAWYYGWGDGYRGQRHAASWHGQTPDGMPETVQMGYPGVATGDWGIPFGTRLCITVVGFPAWSAGEYDDLIGRQVVGVVIDRMAPGYEGALDCWPALFRKLAGPDWVRIGRLEVEYEVCDTG